MAKRIRVIGGGISGLATAYLLKTKGFDTTLLESSPRVGGNIGSERKDGYLIEHGPNSLLRSPRLVDLIDALDLRSEVLAASPAAKKRYVLIDDKLRALPTSVPRFAAGSFFSVRAKLRLLGEPFIRKSSRRDESVAAFFERRFGREVVDKAVDPFISGIYAGDPGRLSIEQAFPAIAGHEREFGSVLVGALRSKREKDATDFRPRSFTFRDGIGTLTDRLRQRLGDSVTTNSAATGVERRDRVFRVTTAAGDTLGVDAVILSTKADAAGDLLEDMDGPLARELRRIYYAPVTVVRSAYRRPAVGHAADGFGFLVAHSAGRRILGSLWTSSVFEGRAPEGMHLFTTFVGGARAAHLCDLSDDEVANMVHSELAEIMNIRELPTFTDITRWERAIPQYNVGYEGTIDLIERFVAANPGVFFCSNFYRGVSVGDCVKNAYRTADEVDQFLRLSE